MVRSVAVLLYDEVTARYYIPYPVDGRVVDNVDPQSLARVKVEIPGLASPDTGWIVPFFTIGGGSAQRGGFVVPDIGASVKVVFIGGDPQRPEYVPGHWGERGDTGSEMPADVRDATSEPHKIQALQLGSFRFVVDERDDKLVFRIEGRDGADVGVGAELDLKKKQVTLTSTVAIILRTKGLIHLDGLVVRIKNRLVGPARKAI